RRAGGRPAAAAGGAAPRAAAPPVSRTHGFAAPTTRATPSGFTPPRASEAVEAPAPRAAAPPTATSASRPSTFAPPAVTAPTAIAAGAMLDDAITDSWKQTSRRVNGRKRLRGACRGEIQLLD